MTGSENQKNTIISYVYLGISLLSLFLGLYGMVFIRKINNIGTKFKTPKISPKELLVFNVIFIVLIIISLFLIIISFNNRSNINSNSSHILFRYR